VARRQTRRCVRVLRGRYQGRGTAPVLFERRQFGERAHPYGHVHRQHRAAPRRGWRTPGQGSGRDCVGGIHHAKQWRLDHVRQTPELTACDNGDHRLAAITLSPAVLLVRLGTCPGGRLCAESRHLPLADWPARVTLSGFIFSPLRRVAKGTSWKISSARCRHCDRLGACPRGQMNGLFTLSKGHSFRFG
jgi:hypothetical protein